MIAYNFHPETREYISRETAQQNPLRPGEYLLPAHATFTEPPVIREGYARVWDGAAWNYTEDHRGETIWKTHDISKICDTLGPIPEGWSLVRPAETVTVQQIQNQIYQEKCRIAYGGITLRQTDSDCLFATDPNSIAMCNAMMLQLSGRPDDTPLVWKVYRDGMPVVISLTKLELERIAAAGMTMINRAFEVEGELYAELAALDVSEYETFRREIATRFDAIGRETGN